MKMTRNNRIKSFKQQQGMTLIELLVAGFISLIAVSGMVLVMASTLGTSTQTIEMSRLTQEMRTAMQIMTRELRRANYHSGFMACYGDTSCLANTMLGGVGIQTWIKPIGIGDSVDTSDCLWFWYDRPQICANPPCDEVELAGDQILLNDESVAAFRRAESGGVGVIQMTTTRDEDTDPCNASDADWVDITDPGIINVTIFTVNDTQSLVEIVNDAGDTQSVERIGLTMVAQLTADPSVPAWIQINTNASRQIDQFVKVRNNTVTAVVVTP